jgi:hypothetical protein
MKLFDAIDPTSDDPRVIADDETLTHEQKFELLGRWKRELIERQQQAEAGQSPSAVPETGVLATKLAEVSEVVQQLVKRKAPGPVAGASTSKPIREPPRKPYRPGHDVPKPLPVDDPVPSKPKGGVD